MAVHSQRVPQHPEREDHEREEVAPRLRVPAENAGDRLVTVLWERKSVQAAIHTPEACQAWMGTA